ncbi:MAG: hypothetical protein DWQ36_03675 [Acidobacteria bacterium]|nr:MAG: hypothetical protein DWQ30_06705 [Acidobacteriota bacterium]REK10633.1 MAG: hypothetical protein DWQ36_03675 [Acidobacteriota bacterium]
MHHPVPPRRRFPFRVTDRARRLAAAALASTAITLFTAALLPAQSSPLPHRTETVFVDSGPVANRSAEQAVVFATEIAVDDATSLRLFFDDTSLAQAPDHRSSAFLRITSLHDGAVQTLDGEELVQWRGSSAFFNGDAVRLELVAPPGAPASRVRVSEVMVGERFVGDRSICGPTDDRTESFDPRDARISPVGCSAWLIDDANGCFLTAGHCTGDSFDVVEFNVPHSDPDGTNNHPPPSDQYAIDLSSLQWDQTVIGNDWAYFGAFPNSETEQTPSEVQGAFYTLGLPASATLGDTIRITGYGSTDGVLLPGNLNQVQKTHTGPLTAISGSVLQYAVDTTGGNSGSAIFDETLGQAIGIHTNAGCGPGGGANNGMGLNNAGVQSALAAPIGICSAGPPPLLVERVSPLPELILPTGTDVFFGISDRTGAVATPDQANLVYDVGDGDQSVPLVPPIRTSAWIAQFPELSCGDAVSWKVTATDGPLTVHHPFSAQNSADRRYHTFVGEGFDTTFRDDFETDQGWTVFDDPSLTDGSWERGLPSGYGMRGDPPWDGDGTGSLYATGLPGGNNDVDGGPTILTSPALDASDPEAHVSYWRWFDDAGASDDSMVVEVSDDDGASWTLLETIGPNVIGEWTRQTFRVADFVDTTDQFRIRFTVSDLVTGNIVEAAVDGVMLHNGPSPVTCVEVFSDGFESGDSSAWSLTTP